MNKTYYANSDTGDALAHVKYVAKIDISPTRKRYFYSAQEYSNYLKGKGKNAIDSAKNTVDDIKNKEAHKKVDYLEKQADTHARAALYRRGSTTGKDMTTERQTKTQANAHLKQRERLRDQAADVKGSAAYKIEEAQSKIAETGRNFNPKNYEKGLTLKKEEEKHRDALYKSKNNVEAKAHWKQADRLRDEADYISNTPGFKIGKAIKKVSNPKEKIENAITYTKNNLNPNNYEESEKLAKAYREHDAAATKKANLADSVYNHSQFNHKIYGDKAKTWRPEDRKQWTNADKKANDAMSSLWTESEAHEKQAKRAAEESLRLYNTPGYKIGKAQNFVNRQISNGKKVAKKMINNKRN